MGQYEKKQKIVDVCLATFMKRGLAHTTTKNLCDTLKMNSGGVFYYFKTKDEIVVACAEEASKRIERDLFSTIIEDIEHPEKVASTLRERAVLMRPLMEFYVSVCASPKYSDKMQPALDRMNVRYSYYIERIAEKLRTTPEEVAPYFYVVTNMVLSYMLFGKTSFTAPQHSIVYDKLAELIEKKNQYEAHAAAAEREADKS